MNISYNFDLIIEWLKNRISEWGISFVLPCALFNIPMNYRGSSERNTNISFYAKYKLLIVIYMLHSERVVEYKSKTYTYIERRVYNIL